MSRELDDPRLTTFALGELDELDERERAELERDVAQKPEQHAEVVEIRAVASALRDALGTEPVAGLDDARRAAIEQRAAAVDARPPRWRLLPTIAIAAAASVATGALAVGVILSYRHRGATVSAGSAPPRIAIVPETQPTPSRAAIVIETQPGVARAALHGVGSFRPTSGEPVSTVSVDVEGNAYAVVRALLRRGQRPPRQAVRTEELVNAMPYAYAEPPAGQPLAIHVDVGACPWRRGHRLARVALQAARRPPAGREAAAIVVAVDLPSSSSRARTLLADALVGLVRDLDGEDRLAIVDRGAVRLPVTPCGAEQRPRILAAVAALRAARHGGRGALAAAYGVAARASREVGAGKTRVLLASDGATERTAARIVEQGSRRGIVLGVLALDTADLEGLRTLAARGRGSAVAIGTGTSAEQAMLALGLGRSTAAKEVAVRVAFNRERVSSYRLLGHDEPGAPGRRGMAVGKSVTTLYEVVPRPGAPGELLSVEVTYQSPEGKRGTLTRALVDDGAALPREADFRLAVATAWFALALRGEREAGAAAYDRVLGLIGERRGADVEDLRELVGRARTLQ